MSSAANTSGTQFTITIPSLARESPRFAVYLAPSDLYNDQPPASARNVTAAANTDRGGEELARKNLENYKDLFTSDAREQAIEHPKEVVEMIHPGYADMQALERGDMAY